MRESSANKNEAAVNPVDSTAMTAAKDQVRELLKDQVKEWIQDEATDSAKDLFKEIRRGIGFGKGAVESAAPAEGVTATSSGGIDFAKSGRDIPQDLAALATDTKDQLLGPDERAQLEMKKREDEYAQRLAVDDRHVQATEKIGTQISRFEHDDYNTFVLTPAEASQDAYRAAFGVFAKNTDVKGNMEDVRKEFARQRGVNNAEYKALQKDRPDFKKDGQNLVVRYHLEDCAENLHLKNLAGEEDLAGERPLERLKRENILPESKRGREIQAEERGRFQKEQGTQSPVFQGPGDVRNPFAAFQAKPLPAGAGGISSGADEEILNRQLDEQIRIAGTLDEINRKGLTLVTRVGMEGL